MKITQLFGVKTDSSQQRGCCHKRNDGAECKAHPRTGSEYCFFHDPALQEKRRAASGAGGAGNRKPVQTLCLPPNPLQTASQIADYLRQAMNQLGQGEVDVFRGAMGIGYLTTVLLQVMGREVRDEERGQRSAGDVVFPRLVFHSTGAHSTGAHPTGGHATGGHPTGAHATGAEVHPDGPRQAKPAATSAGPKTIENPRAGQPNQSESPERASKTGSCQDTDLEGAEELYGCQKEESRPEEQPQGLKRTLLKALAAPFGFAQGRLMNPCPDNHALTRVKQVLNKSEGVNKNKGVDSEGVEQSEGVDKRPEPLPSNPVSPPARQDVIRQEQSFSGVPGLQPRHLEYMKFANLPGTAQWKRRRNPAYVTGTSAQAAEMRAEAARLKRRGG
jgi:hypothetical protein